jgi:hypothetical protein
VRARLAKAMRLCSRLKRDVGPKNEVLDRTRLLQSPDHAIVEKPWQLDVLELRCCWEVGNNGLILEIFLSKQMRSDVMKLRFMGVTDLKLDGFQPLVGLRILDAKQFLPEIPAAICVLHYRWERGDGEPYFWAGSVERHLE